MYISSAVDDDLTGHRFKCRISTGSSRTSESTEKFVLNLIDKKFRSVSFLFQRYQISQGIRALTITAIRCLTTKRTV